MRSWWHKIKFASYVGVNCFLATSPSMADGCDLTDVKSSAKLHDTLSRRAIEAVDRASKPEYRMDGRLSKLVEPSATFNLGAGDVGRPMGNGLEGVRSLAVSMHANSFRFDGWNYMDLPTDGCGTQKVTVDFIDGPGKQSSIVEFTFHEGRIVSGKGWARFFERGLLNPIEGRK